MRADPFGGFVATHEFVVVGRMLPFVPGTLDGAGHVSAVTGVVTTAS